MSTKRPASEGEDEGAPMTIVDEEDPVRDDCSNAASSSQLASGRNSESDESGPKLSDTGGSWIIDGLDIPF